MKVRYWSREIYKRKANGRFTKKRGKFFKVILILIAVGSIFSAFSYRDDYEGGGVTPTAYAEITAREIAREMKTELVDTLKQCESYDATEEDAVINPMDGGSPSFGLLQFKIGTVQGYVKKFEGRDITRYEALQIAMDEEKSRELAERVIFEEVGGIWNWKNCAQKENLAARIEFIRDLEAKI